MSSVEKLEECPDCGKKLSQREYDGQFCAEPCGTHALGFIRPGKEGEPISDYEFQMNISRQLFAIANRVEQKQGLDDEATMALFLAAGVVAGMALRIKKTEGG